MALCGRQCRVLAERRRVAGQILRQNIHMYQVTEEGLLLDVNTIGEYCYEVPPPPACQIIDIALQLLRSLSSYLGSCF